MGVGELIKLSDSKIRLEHRTNRITSSVILSIFFLFFLTSIILSFFSQFPIDREYKILIIGLLYLVYILYAIGKNFYLKKFSKGKIGILLAIDDKGEFEGYKIKKDLLNELNDSLDVSKIEVIALSNPLAKKIKKIYKNENEMIKIHNRIGGMYRIVGATEKEKNGGLKCYIRSEAAVFHKNIPEDAKSELGNDFYQIYLEQIEFDDEYYKSGIEFSAIYNSIVAKYIIGVACLISGAVLSARELHKGLEDKLENITRINNGNQSINEFYFKHLSQKIRFIQYRELEYICSHYYGIGQKDLWVKWLYEWDNLSKKYKLTDAGLLNYLAIYEFLVNKDIKKARKLIKESGKSGNKWYRFSLVFLDLWDKKYNEAKKNIKLLMKKDCNNLFILNSVLKFIDEVLIENKECFEFLYWKALIYYRQSGNYPLALESLEEYLRVVGKNKYCYEVYDPNNLLYEIKKTMKI